MPYPRAYQVIRRFIPGSLINDLQSFVAKAYGTVDDAAANGTLNSDFQITRHWDGLHVPHLKKYLDAETALAPVYQRIQTYFTGAQVIDEECSFRRHRQPTHYIGWHTDAAAAGSAHYDPCFNMWLPLTPVGRTLPSLEIIPSSENLMRLAPQVENNIWPDGWRAAVFSSWRIRCPKLDPGDVVVFSHYCLHRTQPLKDQRGTRISGEFRFTMRPQ
jgi:hypothetical protein